MKQNFEDADRFFVERVSHFIKSRRKKLKLTQSQMASQFKMNINQIWRMELGTETTKLSTALRVISEFAKKIDMPTLQFLSYLLQEPLNENQLSLTANEAAILKSFRKAPPELRRKYSELAEISDLKFSLALEIQTCSTPVVKKILELVKILQDK